MPLRIAEVSRQHPRAEVVRVSSPPASSVRVLLERLVDYAGLFPPAALPMSSAADAFAAYRRSPDAWALGRFVVPVARLNELADTVADSHPVPWGLSVLAGDDAAADARTIEGFVGRFGARYTVDAVEARPTSPDRLERLAEAFPHHVVYAEVPLGERTPALLGDIKRMGLRAKVRTGGITANAFPSAHQLADFIVRCGALELPFKATAGLHHPVCATHPLTYASDAPRAAMFGFVNVFLASAIAREGASRDVIEEVLSEREAATFQFTDGGVSWRGWQVTSARLHESRASHAISFGSCSFREPIDDLHAIGLL